MILVSTTFFRLFTRNFARAIALFPFIIVREKKLARDENLIRHEKIHLMQQKELLILPFYLWYLLEFAIRYFQYRNFHKAYYNISFEREAHRYDRMEGYLKKRKTWAFFSFL